MEILSIATVVLLILKIFGLISVSWLFCFMPFLISLGIYIALLLIVILLAVLKLIFGK